MCSNKQIALGDEELLSLSDRLHEAAELDKMFEVKKLIEKEQINREFLKKSIRELQKGCNDNGKTLEEMSNSSTQYRYVLDLTNK